MDYFHKQIMLLRNILHHKKILHHNLCNYTLKLPPKCFQRIYNYTVLLLVLELVLVLEFVKVLGHHNYDTEVLNNLMNR